jgi:hypothetical protein
MPADARADEDIRESAYFIWEREGRPEGRAFEHWIIASNDGLGEEEKVLAGRSDADVPAMLTKDVPGG